MYVGEVDSPAGLSFGGFPPIGGSAVLPLTAHVESLIRYDFSVAMWNFSWDL